MVGGGYQPVSFADENLIKGKRGKYKRKKEERIISREKWKSLE
jgi:hypothetical protein